MRTSSKKVYVYLLFMLIIALILTHSILSYTLIIITYFIFIIYILKTKFQIHKENKIYYLILMFIVFINNVINPSIKNLEYSLVILFTIIIYEKIGKMTFDAGLLGRFSIFVISTFFLFLDFGNLEMFHSYLLNSNGLAGVYLFLFFLIELFGDNKTKFINYIILMPLLLYLIGSRGLLLTILIYFALRLSYRLKITSILFPLILMSLIIYLKGTIAEDTENNLIYNILNYFNLDVFGRSLIYSGRDILWQTTWNGILKYPFGIGFGESNTYINQEIGTEITLSPHNMYLKILLEGGWLFFIWYIAFMISIIKNSSSKKTKSFLIAIHIRGFFESSFPFGLSMASALIILPYYLDLAYKFNNEVLNEKDNVSSSKTMVIPMVNK